MVDSITVEILGWDDSLNDFFHKFKPHLLELDVFRVLDRDYNSVHTDGDAGAIVQAVLTGHLEEKFTSAQCSHAPKQFNKKHVQSFTISTECLDIKL